MGRHSSLQAKGQLKATPLKECWDSCSQDTYRTEMQSNMYKAADLERDRAKMDTVSKGHVGEFYHAAMT